MGEVIWWMESKEKNVRVGKVIWWMKSKEKNGRVGEVVTVTLEEALIVQVESSMFVRFQNNNYTKPHLHHYLYHSLYLMFLCPHLYLFKKITKFH